MTLGELPKSRFDLKVFRPLEGAPNDTPEDKGYFCVKHSEEEEGEDLEKKSLGTPDLGTTSCEDDEGHEGPSCGAGTDKATEGFEDLERLPATKSGTSRGKGMDKGPEHRGGPPDRHAGKKGNEEGYREGNSEIEGRKRSKEGKEGRSRKQDEGLDEKQCSRHHVSSSVQGRSLLPPSYL